MKHEVKLSPFSVHVATKKNSTAYTAYLKICINVIKLLGVFRKLCPDVFRADEDGLQMGPGHLHFKPYGNDRVYSGELLLPFCDLLNEVAHKLGSHHVLELNLRRFIDSA